MKDIQYFIECDGCGSGDMPSNFATPQNVIGMGNPSDTSGDMMSLTDYIKKKRKNKTINITK